MRMHVKRAAIAQREVVIGAAARRDRRAGDAGHSILLPGRCETVPMDQGRPIKLIFDADAELPSDRRRAGQSRAPMRASHSPRSCGFARVVPSPARRSRPNAARPGLRQGGPPPLARKSTRHDVTAWPGLPAVGPMVLFAIYGVPQISLRAVVNATSAPERSCAEAGRG